MTTGDDLKGRRSTLGLVLPPWCGTVDPVGIHENRHQLWALEPGHPGRRAGRAGTAAMASLFGALATSSRLEQRFERRGSPELSVVDCRLIMTMRLVDVRPEEVES